MLLRSSPALLALLLAPPALAAEVVWSGGAPAPEVVERVAASAGATGPALRPLDVMAAATDASAADARAVEAVTGSLADVRAFETRLDGELVIMREIQVPLDAVTLLRDDADREALVAALLYQGFAVQRFFQGDLATDERAAPWRAEVGGEAVVRPWRDAIALDPDREVSPYDIAEAPQRVAYKELREDLSRALPASLSPGDLPPGARLVLDGREVEPSAGGVIRLRPGLHFAHVERQGRVVARWRLEVEPGDLVPLEISDDTAAWTAWLAAPDTAPPPTGLDAALDALGGEVWLARAPAEGELAVSAWRVRAGTVEPLQIELPAPPAPERPERRWSVALLAGGGWLANEDFYYQDPVSVEPTAAAINAPAAGLGLEAAWEVGPARLGAGVHTLLTLGEDHEAHWADQSTRIRPYPHLAVGLKPVQLTLGWLFPHHATGGLQARIPLGGGVELHGAVLGGLAFHEEHDEHSTWKGAPVYSSWAGLGWRLGG